MSISCLPWLKNILRIEVRDKKLKNSLGLHFFMSWIFDQRRWKLRQESHAARFIMDATSKASSVRLFNDLSWLPLYEEAKISIYLIAF